MSYRGQSWYGDSRSHAPDPWLTCPNPKCLAVSPIDSTRCSECGTTLGLKEAKA